MRYVIHTDRDIAQKECDIINKATQHLWHDGQTKKLVQLETNYDNSLYLYLVIPEYEEYYPKGILDKATSEIPENWFDREEGL